MKTSIIRWTMSSIYELRVTDFGWITYESFGGRIGFTWRARAWLTMTLRSEKGKKWPYSIRRRQVPHGSAGRSSRRSADSESFSPGATGPGSVCPKRCDSDRLEYSAKSARAPLGAMSTVDHRTDWYC